MSVKFILQETQVKNGYPFGINLIFIITGY
jgi:hypothetical protein